MAGVQPMTPVHDLCSPGRLNPSKADQSVDIGGGLSLHAGGVDGWWPSRPAGGRPNRIFRYVGRGSKHNARRSHVHFRRSPGTHGRSAKSCRRDCQIRPICVSPFRGSMSQDYREKATPAPRTRRAAPSGVIYALWLFVGARDEPPDGAVGANLTRGQAVSRPTRVRGDSGCSAPGSVGLAQSR